jgi:hypothetical protein
VLLVHINQFPVGIYPDPLTVEGRAAWFSFAFWLRTVAAVELDIDTNEIQAGFRTYRREHGPAGEAFLCDQLENGAGYCRYLGQPDVFRKLLRQADPDLADTLASQWLAVEHRDSCDASCHRCLRDYNNMPYHALLDWRLALDMALLAAGVTTVDLTSNWGSVANPWQALTRQVAPNTLAKLGYGSPQQFGSLSGYVKQGGQPRVLLQVHPLWTEAHPKYEEARMAVRQVQPSAIIERMNPFQLIRRPTNYV